MNREGEEVDTEGTETSRLSLEQSVTLDTLREGAGSKHEDRSSCICDAVELFSSSRTTARTRQQGSVTCQDQRRCCHR